MGHFSITPGNDAAGLIRCAPFASPARISSSAGHLPAPPLANAGSAAPAFMAAGSSAAGWISSRSFLRAALGRQAIANLPGPVRSARRHCPSPGPTGPPERGAATARTAADRPGPAPPSGPAGRLASGGVPGRGEPATSNDTRPPPIPERPRPGPSGASGRRESQGDRQAVRTGTAAPETSGRSLRFVAEPGPTRDVMSL